MSVSSTAPVRQDGRQPMQLRGRELRLATLSRVDGSCFYAQGQSAVTVSIAGPTAALTHTAEEDCAIHVHISFGGHACSSAAVSRGGGDVLLAREQSRRTLAAVADEMHDVVHDCVASAVMRERYPRCVLMVDVTIMHGDGSVSAVVLNAVMCALLDAGVACRHSFAAVSVAAVMSEDLALCRDGSAAGKKGVKNDESVEHSLRGGLVSETCIKDESYSEGHATNNDDKVLAGRYESKASNSLSELVSSRKKNEADEDDAGAHSPRKDDEKNAANVRKRQRVDDGVPEQCVSTTRALTFWLDPSAAEEEWHTDCTDKENSGVDNSANMGTTRSDDQPQRGDGASVSGRTGSGAVQTVAMGLFVLSNNPLCSSGSALLVSRIHRSKRPSRGWGSLSCEEVESMTRIAERAAPLLFRFMRQCNVTLDDKSAVTAGP